MHAVVESWDFAHSLSGPVAPDLRPFGRRQRLESLKSRHVRESTTPPDHGPKPGTSVTRPREMLQVHDLARNIYPRDGDF